MPGSRRLANTWPPTSAALLFSAVAAVAFVLVSPDVGDLWAARARASAANDGVGLHYWFSWFAGTVPGHYSILAPFLSRFIDVGVLGAVATVAIVPLVRLTTRGCPHPALATWLAAFGSAVSLWSGRVPFAEGIALALLALLCVRGNRALVAAPAAAVAALVSPVVAVFLMLGLAGVFVHDRCRRVAAAVTGAAAGVCLLAIAVLFGTPGPEGFPVAQAVGATAAFAVLLLARPSAEVRTVLIASMIACPLLAIVPNGLGSNFERFAWLCMPVATAATARAGRLLVVLPTVAAMSLTLVQSTKDLRVASQPMSAAAYYRGLTTQLDRTPGLANYRVEVVPDGTHVAAYALLGHAALADGYETQSTHKLNGILGSHRLNATSYRRWLSGVAVRYIALDRTTLTSGPEDRLVRTATPSYLHQVWSDHNWRLYEVDAARPIVPAPAQIVHAGQSKLVIATPRAATVGLRVRWSAYLRVRGPTGSTARLRPDGHGFTVMAMSGPGRFVVSG
ncbi:MAG: hypothetical protein ACR2LX_08500 [Jatrophihabitans sp.]